MNLKTITLALALLGVLALIVGIILDRKDWAGIGIMLAILFGLLRALLSVTRLF